MNIVYSNAQSFFANNACDLHHSTLLSGHTSELQEIHESHMRDTLHNDKIVCFNGVRHEDQSKNIREGLHGIIRTIAYYDV